MADAHGQQRAARLAYYRAQAEAITQVQFLASLLQ